MRKRLIISCLFAVCLLYSLGFHIRLHSSLNSSLDSSAQADITNDSQVVHIWQQAPQLDELYPDPISNTGTGFDYSAIENIVWNFDITNDKQVQINHESTKQLELACSYIPVNVLQERGQRLKFLITKSLPGSAGQDLSELIPRYCEYLEEQDSFLAIVNSLSGVEQLILLKRFMPKTLERQQALFGGSIARQLFTRKNINLAYFTENRILKLRTDLSEADKQTQLQILQKNYKNQLSSLQDSSIN